MDGGRRSTVSSSVVCSGPFCSESNDLGTELAAGRRVGSTEGRPVAVKGVKRNKANADRTGTSRALFTCPVGAGKAFDATTEVVVVHRLGDGFRNTERCWRRSL